MSNLSIKGKFLVYTCLTVLLLLALYFLFPQFVAGVIVLFRYAWTFLAAIVIFVIIAIVANESDSPPVFIVACVVGVFIILASATNFAHYSYNNKHPQWVQSMEEGTGKNNSFKQRGPIDVARKQASNAMGGNAGETLVDETTRYVAD